MPPSKMLGKGGDQTGRTIANRKARRLGHLSAGCKMSWPLHVILAGCADKLISEGC